MPFFRKLWLMLRKNKKKKKISNQRITPVTDTMTSDRIDHVMQNCRREPSTSNLNQSYEINNSNHLVANNAAVNKANKSSEKSLKENDAEYNISCDNFRLQNSEYSQPCMCAKLHLNDSDVKPTGAIFKTDYKKKKNYNDHHVDADLKNSEDSENYSLECTRNRTTVSEKGKYKMKKKEKIDQCIRSFSDITIPTKQENVIDQCNTKLSSCNFAHNHEMNYLEHIVANNASGKKTSDNPEKAPEKCDDFNSQNSENFENNRQVHMIEKFHLNDSDTQQEGTVAKTADTKRKKNKIKVNSCDSYFDYESQIFQNSEYNFRTSACTDFYLNDLVENLEVSVVEIVDSGKNKRLRSVRFIKPFSDITTCTINSGAIQLFGDVHSSSSSKEDDEMNDSDHSVISNISNNEKIENIEKTLEEQDINYEYCYDNSPNFDISDNRQTGIFVEFSLNGLERTAFNVWRPQEDISGKSSVFEKNNDFEDVNTLQDSQTDITAITVTRQLDVLVLDDILETIYIQKLCDIINNITANRDVIGRIEELNNIEDATEILRSEKMQKEAVKCAQDVNVDGTVDKDVDSYKTVNIHLKKLHTIHTNFNREYIPPTSFKDILPLLIENREHIILPTNNILVVHEKGEVQDSYKSSKFESNSSFSSSNEENQEAAPYSSTTQMESCNVIIIKTDNIRYFGISESESHESKKSEPQIEIHEFDSTFNIQEGTYDTDISKDSMKNIASNLLKNEMIIDIKSEHAKDKSEVIIRKNTEIKKSGGTTSKMLYVLTNTDEYVSAKNDKFKKSTEKMYSEIDFHQDNNTMNNFSDMHINFEPNNCYNVALKTKTFIQNIFRDINVQLECKPTILEGENCSTETTVFKILQPADLKSRIDVSAYQASEKLKLEMFPSCENVILTEETRSIQDIITDHISKKQSQVIYLIYVNTKPVEQPTYKNPSNPAHCDNLKSQPEYSEIDYRLSELKNCVIDNESDVNCCFAPQIQKFYLENTASDDTSENIITKNNSFEVYGKEDLSQKDKGNFNLNIENEESFIFSTENKNENNTLQCKQKENPKYEIEKKFMSSKENLKDKKECETNEMSKDLIFDSNLEVTKQCFDVYDTGENYILNPKFLNSSDDVPVSNVTELENFESVLCSSQHRKNILDKQSENTLFESNIFDETQNIDSGMSHIEAKSNDEIYIDNNKYSQTHSDSSNDSSERKFKSPSFMNYQNFNSVADIQVNDIHLMKEINKMFQDSTDLLFLNSESHEDDNILCEVSNANKCNVEETTYFQDSDETLSDSCQKEKQNKHSTLQCFNQNCHQMLNDQCKESIKTTINLQSEAPEDNFLLKEIPDKILSDMLKKHDETLVPDNNRRIRSASECSLLTCSISSESSESKVEDVMKQGLKSAGDDGFMSTESNDCADEENFPDKVATHLNFDKIRQPSEMSAKLKNTFTIHKERLPNELNQQNFEISNSKILLENQKDGAEKNEVRRSNDKHIKLYTNSLIKGNRLEKNSSNMKKISRFQEHKTSARQVKSSPPENKRLQQCDLVQTVHLDEFDIESFKQHSSQMTPIRRIILDSSRSIRSPKYPSPLRSKRTDKKEIYPPKSIFITSTKQKVAPHGPETSNQDFENVEVSTPRNRLTEGGYKCHIHYTQNYRAISPDDLKSKFDDVFKKYAGKFRSKGDLITFQRSTELLRDAGIIGKKLSATEATDSFKTFAGVKITLNKEDYRHFLRKLTMKKRLNYNEVYKKVCNAPEMCEKIDK